MDKEILTDLQMRAAGTHELFMAYVGAGFTREEALQIILVIISTGMQTQQPE